MSATTPAYPIPRWSVVGMEGMFTKMWDPPTESPSTPDLITPTNPVPEVLFAAGIATSAPVAPHTMSVDLLHGITVPTWDGAKNLAFYTVINNDIPLSAAGSYPSSTIRVPVGTIFHAETSGKGPPPHTIHWHGIEPTPMNDGVGHCSMEIGKYNYQWQQPFIGTYFYHCHRNTMQHFEFGLFGLLIYEPADAYHATLIDPSIPIGHCRDGKRRTAANLQNFPQFPGWVGGDRTDPDPWAGNVNLRMENIDPIIGNINPHAQTVPYDVEGLWVFDDRDSNWSDNAPDARTTFPHYGNHPGYDDNFTRNPGQNGFFSFNDYHADYWFVTGVPVPAPFGGTGTIPAGVVVPKELNSGITGSQVSIEAYVGQTVFLRVLDAAYNNCRYTFPDLDVVIVEWDGRPLGVPPYGFNEPYVVPKGTPIEVSVGRRFGALIREFSPVSTFGICELIDTRGAHVAGFEQVNVTAKVPINISPLTITATSDKPSPQPVGTPVTFTATMTGTPNGTNSQAPTTGFYEYRFYVNDGKGAGYVLKQNYSQQNTYTHTPVSGGIFDVFVEVRAVGSSNFRDAYTLVTAFNAQSTAATGLTLSANKTSPQAAGTPITITANQQGGAGSFEYRFYVNDGSGAGFVLAQDYSASNTFVWTPATNGNYDIFAEVRLAGTAVLRDAFAAINFFQIQGVAPATAVSLTADAANTKLAGQSQTFHALASGGSGTYEYRFYVNDGSGAGFVLQGPYAPSADLVWTPGAAGNYDIFVEARSVGSTAFRDTFNSLFFYRIN